MSGPVLKKVLLATLAILLIAIWVRNLFMFVPASQSGGSTQTPNHVNSAARQLPEAGKDTLFSLDPNVRDPFEVPKSPQPKLVTATATVPVPRPVETIHASLKGHVFNAQQPYIVAFDSMTEMTSLYRTGDSLNGYVLEKIARSEILWRSQKGRRVVWKTDE